jgi:hypothetical protein
MAGDDERYEWHKNYANGLNAKSERCQEQCGVVKSPKR